MAIKRKVGRDGFSFRAYYRDGKLVEGKPLDDEIEWDDECQEWSSPLPPWKKPKKAKKAKEPESTLPRWEEVAREMHDMESTMRLAVPGGWLYRCSEYDGNGSLALSTTFVPDTTGEI